MYKSVVIAMVMTILSLTALAWYGLNTPHVGPCSNEPHYRYVRANVSQPGSFFRRFLPRGFFEEPRVWLAQPSRTSGPSSTSSFFAPEKRRPRSRTFCLVIGPEGTGSTWISKILPADYRPPEDRNRGITATLHKVWGSGPLAEKLEAQKRLVHDLRHLVPRKLEKHGRAVLHISAPDWDADHYPDLHSSLWSSFYQAHLNLRVIVLYRDPAQAAYSNYRRQWPHLQDPGTGRPDLVRSARSTEKHMTLLSEQIRCLIHPHDVLVLDYQQLMLQPEQEASRIAKYLWMNAEESERFAKALKDSRVPPNDFAKDLSRTERQFLQRFFDAERCAKWGYLQDRARHTKKKNLF